MTKWFWRWDGNINDGTGVDWRAHGKDGVSVPWPEGVTDDWLRKYGFKTRAAAVRSAGGNYMFNGPAWKGHTAIESKDIDDNGLHYRIYRCYEIVILDAEENQIGDSNYCYGTRTDAERDAEHYLKLTEMEGC